MLPLLATSLATVVSVILLGGDFNRLFFVFPTFQITSYKIVDFSLSSPTWCEMNLLIYKWVWRVYDCGFWKTNSKLRLPLGDVAECIWGDYEQQSSADRASFEISAEIHAGISINNTQNSFGAHIHRAILDMYHPEWENKLVHIGSIHDRENGGDVAVFDSQLSTIATGTAMSISHNNSNSLISDCWENEGNHSIVEEKMMKRLETPSFSILPRQIFHSIDDAISIHIKHLSQKMLRAMIYSFLTNRLVLNIKTSGVVHLKTMTSSVSLTAGVVCDNELKFLFPSIHDYQRGPWLNIDKVDCRIERLSTGWGNITRIRGDMSQLLLSQNEAG